MDDRESDSGLRGFPGDRDDLGIRCPEAIGWLLEAGDARAALAALETYPDADRWSDRRYWLLMGLVRHALGEYHEAIAAANWALSVEPHDAQLHMIRFDAEREAGLLANAEVSVLTAIRLQPAEVTHHVAYAWLLTSAGQLEKAKRVNAAARRIAADHVEVGGSLPNWLGCRAGTWKLSRKVTSFWKPRRRSRSGEHSWDDCWSTSNANSKGQTI